MKENMPNCGPQNKNQRKLKERQVQRPCQKTKTAKEHESVTMKQTENSSFGKVAKGLKMGLEELEIGISIETTKTDS